MLIQLTISHFSMKKLHTFLAILIWSLQSICAQNTFKAKIIDGDCGENLTGATALLQGTDKGAIADAEGMIIINDIPDGQYTIIFSCIGYETERKNYNFPLANPDEIIVISLEEDENELDEVVITSTRGTRTINDIPTRVEFIGSEELEEKNLMKP